MLRRDLNLGGGCHLRLLLEELGDVGLVLFLELSLLLFLLEPFKFLKSQLLGLFSISFFLFLSFFLFSLLLLGFFLKL